MFKYTYREYICIKFLGDLMAIQIDSDKCGHVENCMGGGICIKICEQGALVEENGDVKIIPDNCDDCDLCISNCPNQAIMKI